MSYRGAQYVILLYIFYLTVSTFIQILYMLSQ